MEGEELDQLINLIDHDSDDDFIDQLYDTQEQDNLMSAGSQQDDADVNNEDAEIKTPQDEVSPKNMSKRMTEMEKYIKFLEAQLKTKNEEKKKSPQNKLNKKDDCVEKPEDISSTKKFYNQEKISPNSSNNDSFVKKPRVAHTPSTSKSSSMKSSQTEGRRSAQKRKAEEPAPHMSSAKKTTSDMSPAITDEYSGLRIVNPLISSDVMKRRMDGRRIIRISSIQSKICNSDIEGDWVTMGVVIQKLPKKTVKGEMYSIWKLSDLAFHLQTSSVSLFLFGENHKQHWKTVEGSVVAVLNPSILPSKEKQSSDIALSLDNPQKLMMIGMSQDFGVCQSSRKSDGKRCSNFINKAEGNFCQYHVQREYSKKRSKRMECQQGYGAPSKLPASKLRQKFTSESFVYGGKIVSSSPAPQSRKEKVTLKNLAASSGGGKDYLKTWKDKQNETKTLGESSGGKDAPSDDFLSLLNVPSVGSRNLKLHLHKEEDKEKEVNEPKPMLSASEFFKTNNIQHGKEQLSKSFAVKSRTKSSAEPTTPKDSSSVRTPVLGRGLSLQDDIVFDENVPLNFQRKPSGTLDKAKQRALAMVRKTGTITAKDPNDVKVKKPSPKSQDAIKCKLQSDEESVSNSEKIFSLADGFSLDSDEGQRILKAKSKHIGEVRQAELEREDTYFSEKEKKEEMETKMLLTKEMKVTVVQCPQCEYVAEKPSVKCKKENHSLQSLLVMKKFFACRDCGERTVAYGQRYPTRECRKCGAKNWEKCGMWKEKNGPKLGGETLMVRGVEYGKFLNSCQVPKTNGILPKYL